jgi:hypothetical protein
MANNYFEFVKPTFIENWPKELCSLSIAQSSIELSYKDTIEPLLSLIWDGKETPAVDILEKRITCELEKFPKGAFVRLGSRSPKDVDIRPCFLGVDAIRLFLNSMRVFDDWCDAVANKYNSHIFFREWKEIPQWTEFRCFMKNRKLVGFSQYNYLKGVMYPEIKENEESIIHLILEFFDYFKKVSHLDNVVFDVFVTKRLVGNQNYWEIKLLEINPFFELTDPCLFDWRKPEQFDGSFRFNN